MAIKQTTPQASIDAYIAKQVQTQTAVLVRTMCYCGEEVLNAAKSTNSYKNQTGNLRSSLGYAVVLDGRVVSQAGFDVVLNGQEGAADGREYLSKLVSQYRKGIVLIVVAGKNYAGYVSAKGFDVLDSAELLAAKLVPMYLKQLGFR